MAQHALDEVAKHPLGRLEVGDHAVLERPDDHDVGRRPADHLLRLGADRDHRTGHDVDGDDRRLVQHDPAAPLVDDRVGGAEIDGQVTAEEAARHVGRSSPARCVGALVLGAVRAALMGFGHRTNAAGKLGEARLGGSARVAEPGP